MKKYKMGLVITIILLYGFRVWLVNQRIEQPLEKTFPKGEVVAFGEDYTLNSQEGSNEYTVKVLSSVLLPIQAFYQKYQLLQGEIAEDTFSKYYYLVDVMIANTSDVTSEAGGINLAQVYLTGTTYFMVIDRQVFEQLNPEMPGTSFSLRAHSEMRMLLPYAVVPETHTDPAGFLQDPPRLQITEYPQRKLLAVS